MTAPAENRRVDANPDKRFFIRMLIKDIELTPAIVDLVDNSVDAARAYRGTVPMTQLFVRIQLNGERFYIEDNCGGMEAETARRYAFRFGRPEDFAGLESSVGQFGIGMKRALFKLGNHFTVVSIAERSRFTLSVDVPDWEKDLSTDWTFLLDNVDDANGGAPDERGVQIEVTDLHANVAQDLTETEVIGRLRAEIELKHQIALAQGLQITVNDQPLSSHRPTMVRSTQVKPVHESLSIGSNGGVVETTFYAGLAGVHGQGDALKDEAEATQFTETGPAGWYIYCNNRLVLAADKTSLTGWGSAAAAYHPQYRRFRGYVYMEAKDSSLLPWNTTKTGLDQDAIVFRRVQQEMFRILRLVQAVINAAKKERQENEEADQPLNSALDAAANVEVKKLPKSKRFVAPSPGKRRAPSNSIRVQYSAPKSDVERVMDALGVDSASQAGLETFRHFLETELE